MVGVWRRPWFCCALPLLAWWNGAVALDTALDVNQYAHTAWRIREGFAKSAIISMAQTTDGYLWLGTESGGLLRFDGVRNVPWPPPGGESLPDTYIRSLLAARDGTLWIGTLRAGLLSLKGGRIARYPQVGQRLIGALLQDREGTIWAAARSLDPRALGWLCAIRAGAVHCEGDDGRFGTAVGSLYEDAKGQLWATATTGLWRVRPGAAEHRALSAPIQDSLQPLGEDNDGALLISTRDGITRLTDGADISSFVPLPDAQPRALLRDRDGGIWIGTGGRGLLHVHDGRTDVFDRSDGLSAEVPHRLFEDREGSVWVATQEGLDRFRDVVAPTYTVRQGLSNPEVCAVLVSRDGALWINTRDGLNRWRGGEMTVYSGRRELARLKTAQRPTVSTSVHEITVNGLPDGMGSLFEDDRGRIWLGSGNSIGYLQDDRYVALNGPWSALTDLHGAYVDAIVEDRSENLWIAHRSLGLLRLSRDGEVQQIPWSQLSNQNSAYRLAVDPKGHGLWLGFFLGGVAQYDSGRLRAFYSAADGLAGGHVYFLHADADGTLWIGTEGGLSRLKNGHFATLGTRNGLPCDLVDWMIDDNAGAVWVNTICGIARIARSDLDSWGATVDRGGDAQRQLAVTVYDNSEGVHGTYAVGSYSPHVAESPDGRLWFATADGVSVLNPRHLPHNALPPPVHIEEVIADRQAHAAGVHLDLPPQIRDLQIDYTALSLVAPEKVLFRYKLENHDPDWQDVGTRRQAYYADLAPGSYRFRVMASNNSGVWNEQGATLDFDIAPAYWQTTWFRAACVLALAGLLWTIYQLRLRQVTRSFNMTLEARVSERTRIARELHDTLLQSFQGLLLRFQTVADLLPDRPADAKRIIISAVDQTAQAITEGRNAVKGLRSSAVESDDFAEELRTLGELAAAETNAGKVGFVVEVEGTPQALKPIVRDEIYRIAGEALRNAFRHARATRIEVVLRYDKRRLQLRVGDNGKGIDPKVLSEGESAIAGHHGLRGMHERASLIGGKVSVWSAPNSGTELELTVRASYVYATSASGKRSWLVEMLSKKSKRARQ